jgi:hypothetical protein
MEELVDTVGEGKIMTEEFEKREKELERVKAKELGKEEEEEKDEEEVAKKIQGGGTERGREKRMRKAEKEGVRGCRNRHRGRELRDSIHCRPGTDGK